MNIATWEKAYTNSSNGDLIPDFVDSDPDRFYVRIPKLGSESAATGWVVKLSTKGPDPAYDDDATEIEMETDPDDSSRWRSKAQILVSDAGDDQFSGNGAGTDNVKGDRTHIAQLGSKLIVEVSICGSTTKIEYPVPDMPIKTVSVHAVVLCNKNEFQAGHPYLAPTFTEAKAIVANDINIANERFAQAGIRMDLKTVDRLQPDYGFEWPNQMSFAFSRELGTIANALLDDVFVFYIPAFGFSPLPGRDPDNFYGWRDSNCVFIRCLPKGDYYVVPHEMGHVIGRLGDVGGTAPVPVENLMDYPDGKGSGVNNVHLTKRLWKSQIESCRKGVYAK